MKHLKQRNNKKLLLSALLGLAIVVIACGVLYKWTHRQRGVQIIHTSASTPSTKGEQPSATTGNPATQTPNTVQPGDSKSNTTGTTTNPGALLTPTGPFVSNHSPNLSGKPAPNQMQSTCNTTPGASCQISFTKDGVTKTLPATVADRGGAVFWSWTLQDIGLTEGSWSIQAKATLGSQTQTANDALELKVGP